MMIPPGFAAFRIWRRIFLAAWQQILLRRLGPDVQPPDLLRGNFHRSRPCWGDLFPRGELRRLLGLTTGRGKNDQTNKPNRPIKEILGLPLTAPRFP